VEFRIVYDNWRCIADSTKYKRLWPDIGQQEAAAERTDIELTNADGYSSDPFAIAANNNFFRRLPFGQVGFEYIRI